MLDTTDAGRLQQTCQRFQSDPVDTRVQNIRPGAQSEPGKDTTGALWKMFRKAFGLLTVFL